MTVHVPDEESVERNLLPEDMVPVWMEEGRKKLAGKEANAGRDLLLT
jgi:hypothetical protein